MKTRFFQVLLLTFAMTVIFASCGKDEDPPVVIDTYETITEGKVFLPVLVSKPDMEKVKRTEEARKGTFKGKSTVKISDVIEADQYTFTYNGMDFSEVIYVVNAKTGKILWVIMDHGDNESVDDKVKDLAKRNGFTDDHYIAVASGSLVQERDGLFDVRVRKHNGKNKIIFYQFGKQPKAMPTIKEFHYEMTFMLNKPEYRYAQIKNKEKELGSTLLREDQVEEGKYKGKVEYALFECDKRNAPLKHRSYFIDWNEDTPPGKTGMCNEVMYIYYSVDLGFYKDDIRGAYLMTREFWELLKEEGYVYYGYVYGHAGFKNTKDKTVIGVRKANFTDINNAKDIFAINLFKLKE